MDKQQARNRIKEIFEQPFDKARFTAFIKDLLNHIEDAPFTYQGNLIPDSYKPYISKYERIGKYHDGENRIDILIVHLNREKSIERARSMQRNFVAGYLQGKYGSSNDKEAAIVAFVSPNETDWRFSLVKMDYRFEEGGNGKVKVKEEFTPARRWSFLVGSNEASHTAQSRLVSILADDEHNPTLKQLENAFDIETVTKEFFRGYRDLFIRTKEALDKVVERDAKVKADFEANGVDTVNFAKKLLGQIVFLYFLQKKGWFGVERDDEWGTGSKHFLRELFEGKHCEYKNFFNDILEPLFYDALSRDRSDIDHWNDQFKCKIPFLNGGLFDPIGNYGWYKTDIFLPNELFSNNVKTREGDIGTGILDVFDRYNFTVKEDEPLEKDVAIDPELLGKAYEKFNAIRPDNFDEFIAATKSGQKGAENKFNKKFGVYYTPREIVHYMCQQSLINYLHTELNKATASFQRVGDSQTSAFGNEGKKGQLDITAEVTSNPDRVPNPVRVNQVSKKDIETLIKFGDQVGEHEAAFVEKEQRIAEGKQKSTTLESKLPQSIRQSAEMIDRALADITVCDPAIGSGAFPVGMMHEIVKTRNLLSHFLSLRGTQVTKQSPGTEHEIASLGSARNDSRSIYTFKRECIEKSLYGVDIDPGAVEIAKLRLWLSLVVDEEDIRRIKPLPNLDYKIVCGNSLMHVKRDLLNDHLFKDLEELKPLYFNETNPTQKHQYRNKIGNLISQITNGHVEFDFEVYFSEVFHHRGGFDVVIANPPYGSKLEKNEILFFRKHYSTVIGHSEVYYLFVEKTIRSLMGSKGFYCFVIPNSWLTNKYAMALRQLILTKTKISNLINLNKRFFFEAGVENSVLIGGKDDTKKELIAKVGSDIAGSHVFDYDYSEWVANDRYIIHFSDNRVVNSIIDRVNSVGVKLEQVLDISNGFKPYQVGYGLNETGQKVTHNDIKNKIYHSNVKKGDAWKKEIKGKNIQRFSLQWDGNYVKWGRWLMSPKDVRYFTNPKILIRQILGHNNFIATFDAEDYFADQTLYTCIKNPKHPENHLYYFLAIINSSLYGFYFRKYYSEEDALFPKIKVNELKNLPVVAVSPQDQKPFISLIDKILKQKKANPPNDISALEAMIDQMVYQLYGLTEEEIRIVEGEK